MNFEFNDEQKLFAEQVRRFAQQHLAAGALARANSPTTAILSSDSELLRVLTRGEQGVK